MADSSKPDINCFWGTPVWNGTEWKCPVDRALETAKQRTDVQTVTPAPTNILTGGIGSIVDWVKGHPVIAIGGIGLILWFLFLRDK